MLFSRWLPSRKRKHAPSRRPSRPSAHRKCKLAVEFLENRLVPSTNQDFVQQAFQDLLHRPVDPGSLTSLAGALETGAVSRTDVAGFIVTSPEARAVQTHDFFNRYLHRAADVLGLNAFTHILLAGGTLEQVGAALLGSPEYFAQRGGTSNLGFLNALYQDTLGRPMDSTGQTFFTGALNAGASREAIAGFVLTSPEYRTGLIQSFFQTYLHRPAEPDAVNVFTSALASGVRQEVILAFLVASPEYFARAQPDVQPPTVTPPSPVPNPTNASPTAPRIALNAGTLVGTAEPGSMVRVFQDGTLVATLPTGDTGAWSYTPALAEGTYHFTATATNAFGNTSPVSSEVLLTIDTTAPNAPSLAFNNGTLSGTAEPGSTVRVLKDSTLVVTVTVDNTGTWTAPLALGAGTYHLKAFATDAAGNIRPASSELIVTMDTTTPNAPSLAFSNGTLSGTAAPGSTVHVFRDSTLVVTVTVDNTGAWSSRLTLADGTYHFTATATDAAGNTRPASSEVLVTLDTRAPNAPSIARNGWTLSGTAEPSSIVRVLQDGNLVATLPTGGTGAWSLPLTFKDDGMYRYTATATDAAGNTSPASSLVVFTIDVTPPPSAISSPAFGSSLDASGWDGSITGTASDSSTGVQRVEVSIAQARTGLYWDGSAFASATEVFLSATGTTSWSLSFPAANFPATDAYIVHSQATDLAGNVEPVGASSFFSFTVR